MAIRIMPQAAIEPVRSQTGGAQGRVEPVRDASGASMLAVGEGAVDLGRAVTVAADRFQDEVDRTQSERMRNLYSADADKEMQDPETGFLATLGMDASPERRKQTFERLRLRREKIEAMGKNDAQKQNFIEHANRIDEQTNTQANVHQVRELRNWKAAETRVAADIGIRKGIEFHGTEEGDVQVAVAMQKLDTLADLYGWPKGSAMREQLKQQATDTLHGGVVDQLVTGNQPAQAHAYLEDVRRTMSPQVAAQKRQLVDRAITDQVGRNVAVDAIARAENEVRMRRDEKEQNDPLGLVEQEFIRQRAYSIVDENESLSPAHREEARQRLDFIDRRRAEVAAGQKNVTRTQAEAWLSQNPLNGTSELPADLYVAAQRAGILPSLNEFARSGRYVTNSKAYDELRTMNRDGRLATMSEEVFRSTFRGFLDNGDYSYAEALWKRAHGNKDGTKVITDRERIEENAKKLGIVSRVTPKDPTAKAREDEAEYAYRLSVQQDIESFEKATGKEASDKDIQQILDDDAIDRVMIDDAFSDTETVMSRVSADDAKAAYVNVGGEPVYLNDVPAGERAAIVHEIERHNARFPSHQRVPITQQQIVERWVRAGRPGKKKP